MDRPRKRPGRRYLKAYSALYGAAVPEHGFCGDRASMAPKLACRTEHQEQCAVVEWARAKRLPLVAVPNGAKRSLWEGARQKAAGLSPGFPDLMLLVARKSLYAMFIEMKRIKSGKVSEEQAMWMHWLNANGYHAIIAYGAAEAILAIEKYLQMPIA